MSERVSHYVSPNVLIEIIFPNNYNINKNNNCLPYFFGVRQNSKKMWDKMSGNYAFDLENLVFDNNMNICVE